MNYLSYLYNEKFKLIEQIKNFYNINNDILLYGSLSDYYDKLYYEMHKDIDEINNKILKIEKAV